MARTVAIGYQSYQELVEKNAFYVDKTLFIKEWWENLDQVTLITRPRRFGKTLNMSMVEQFFSVDYAGQGKLFEGRKIWAEEKYRQIQGTYPVISLSFAPVKEMKDFSGMRRLMCRLIYEQYSQRKYLLDVEGLMDEKEKRLFDAVSWDMDEDMAAMSLNMLSKLLMRHYGKKVIILLDEYDTPMQEAYVTGYWNEMTAFMRNLFNATFKTNVCLERAILTGITRISKESIFSDLNNLEVVTTTLHKYEDAFGFTQEEISAALLEFGLSDMEDGVKDWYDGFTFGARTDIYNPWSIASFISKKGEYRAYWANTSGNELVSTLVQRGNADVKQTMESLLQGNCFQTELDEQIVFHNLKGSANAVWSLLLATGYLKVEKLEYIGIRKKAMYTLALTNMEVINMFENMVKGWFREAAEVSYNRFIKALLLNDVEAMNEFINKGALHSFSSFDIANGVSDDDAPERFYHGFVLGLIVELEGRFRITSNRESGFGRYDIMITPFDRKQDCAYIIEFKVHKPRREKNLEETVANALSQIEKKQYETVLTAEGFEPEQIRKYGFAFEGKRVLIG